jgi:hypothetical protein
MGSVSMMRQNPYYLGQVNKDVAENQFQNSQDQLAQTRVAAVQAQKESEAQQQAALDQSIQQGVGTLGKAGMADKKAGRLGKFFTKEPITGVAGMNAMTEVGANAVNTTSAAFAPIAAAPTAATIGQAGQLVNPIMTSAGGNAATQMVVGQAAPTMSVVRGAPITGAANVASTGTGAAGTAASGMSALTSGLIGVAGNIAGTVIKNKTNDNSAYTATKAERTGNVVGSGVKSAATGFVLGNMLLPGVGGAIGAGIGAGVGALKARKENKAAEEEAKRLQREQAAMRGAYQSAFVNSRLTGADTGFGMNSSTNMNNQFTSQYQVAKLGGVTGIQEDRRLKRVPGGIIVPIEGTDAVEFKGRSHKQGGIIIDKDAKGEPTVEVENDEVMLPLKMKDGKKQDYIFSDYLKIGGKSFAQRSKEILKGAGSQANLQQLATMQEKMAGRNSETVSVAKYGGIPQYATGGVPANDCPSGTIYNAATKKCEPFSFNSIANMVTGKTPINVANNTTDPATNSKPAVPIAISKPKKDRPLEEKYEGWKYVYDIAKSLGDPFPELTASQWAQESGWGESLTGRNNPFGQTTKDRSKGTSLGTPRDPGPKGQTKIFINYDNYEQAILDHLKKWKLPGNSKNTGVENAKDAREAVYLIQRHGENDRYAEGYDNNWEGYVENTMKIADAQSKRFGVYRESTYVPDKTKYPKAKGVESTAPVKETPKKLPPPPVSGDVVPPTFAQRNALPGIGAMQMNEEIQMPEQPKSNVAFDPTGPDNVNGEPGPIRFITADKDQAVRPDGIRLFQDKKTKEYIYRDGNNNEIIRGTDRNALENQIAALQPGFSGFDAQLLEAEAPVQRQDLTGVKPNFAAVTPTNGQTAANNQTVIAQQNGTTNAPASESSWIDEMWANQNATAYNAPAGVSPTATNGGPGTAPTINNQNSTFQYTAQTPGYLDYNDPNTAGGIFSGDRYEKDWKPLVGSTMADAAKADQVINYLTNYTGTDAEDVKAKLKGKNRAEQIAAINDLATDTKVGPFHNAVFGAMQQVNSGGGDVATNIPPVIPPVVPPSTTSGTTATTRRYTPCPPGTYRSGDGSCKDVGDVPQASRISGALMAGLGQLIPVGAALANPYKIAPGIMGAPGIKGALMPRVNLNQERASAIQQNVAYKNAVLGQNAGPASLVAMQSANTKTNQQMLTIAQQEQNQNRQLAAQEASLAMDASKFNADTDQKRQMFNTEFNQGERRYRREDILGALDTGASRIAGIVKDDRAFKADERLANALDETGSYDRFSILEQLNKEAKRKNFPYYGTTETERRRIAAAMHKELNPEGYVGKSEYTKLQEEKNKLQKEKEEKEKAEKEGKAKFGGARQYVSRLGQLSGVRATKAKI